MEDISSSSSSDSSNSVDFSALEGKHFYIKKVLLDF
jgi:hypothetical protein